MNEQIKKLLVNIQQSFTEVEKAQGRSNLGCAAATDIPTDAVKYTSQTLSNIEKAQARQNINAATGDVATTSSDGLMSATDKAKLDGIAAGAEVNVQSDWHQSNTSADDYIKNKPSNATSSTDGLMSAADKTKLNGLAPYTAGQGIGISNNVITNTMHENTSGLLVSYNSLTSSGTTDHTFGPWKLRIEKSAMATWDTGSTSSLHVKVAHNDFLDGSITNGRILADSYYPWKDGAFTDVYTIHNQWAFSGTYSQGGSNEGFQIQLVSPMDADSVARACPKGMMGYKLKYNCGIDRPDWIELDIAVCYTNNNTSINSNALRIQIAAKYFYV
jgi:hypothetical protein